MRKLLFKSKFPQFFKIILQEAVAQGRLEIPRRFVRKCGNDLPDKIFLQVPGGSVWKVELVKRDNGLWLHNGWREFQEYYSIAHGSFLVFKYVKRSYFHVVIFDKSATEIDYPYDDDDDDDGDDDSEELMFERECKEARTEGNVDDSASVEILDDCLPSSKKREKSPLPCPRPPKVARTRNASKPESKADLHTSFSAKRGNISVSSRKQKENRIGKNRSNNLKNLGRNTSRTSEPQEIAALTSLKKSRAFTKAAGFKSENPSFVVVMRPAFVYGASVNIPFKFATNHLKQNGDNVILQINSEGKTWNVSCIMYSDCKVARLSSGWSAFVRDNNLETGEKCVFELIDHAELVLNVVIIRASEEKITRLPEPIEKFRCAKTMRTTKLESPSFKSEDSCKERGKLSNKNVRKKLIADKKANAVYRAIAAFQSANPSFTLFLQPSYIRSRLDIPFPFAKTHFKEDNGEIVLQHSDGRTWTVCCRINGDSRRAYFNCGWNAFVLDNSLKVGNICVFELIKSAELVLKVSIIRAGDSHPSVGSIRCTRANVVKRNTDRVRSMCRPDGKSAADRQFPSCSWMPKAVEAAEKFTPMHPYFKASMKSSNLHLNVTVPKKFMELIQQEAENVVLQLPNGEKRWPVKLLRYPEYKVWKLAAGWSAFSRENRLRVGDICAFELVDTEPLLLKVSIFRRNG